MAALDATQVRVAVTGSVWKAPIGSPLPVDSTTAYDVTWTNLGYLLDGFTITQDLKFTEVTGWQTLETLRMVTSALNRKFGFELMQSNKATIAAAFGGATIVPTVGTSIGTVVIAITTGVLTTSVAHNLTVGQAVQMQGVSGGLPFASNTTYWVASTPTGTTLTLSATSGGAYIPTTTAGTATGIGLLSGVYTLTPPNAANLLDFQLGFDVSDGVTTQRFVIPRAHQTTLPTIKEDRVGAVSFLLEVQALVPASGTSLVIYGSDTNIGQ